MIREGPTTIATEYRSCSGCRFLGRRMMASGRDPIYSHVCHHPEINEPVRGCFSGRLIGPSDATPEWCPFLAESKP